MENPELVKAVCKAGKYTLEQVRNLLSSASTSFSQPEPGSVWVTVLNGNWLSHQGIVLSAFYHPTKTHMAITIGRSGTKRSTEFAGKWAVSMQTRGAFGNKAHYNILSQDTPNK